jgi:16S rRNA (guanine527-N7)-methyltransferase
MTIGLSDYVARTVSRETAARLDHFAALLKEENERQNLVARSTLNHLWERHIADSAQLVRFEPRPGASWVDIGAGAGLPGVVIACLTDGPVTLVEPRRLRAEFLRSAVAQLGLADRVSVVGCKAQTTSGTFDVITARAVASVDPLLGMTLHLSHPGTVWVLPKGRNAKTELEEARRNWHCDGRAEGSMTDPESEVLVLHNVRPKGRG